MVAEKHVKLRDGVAYVGATRLKVRDLVIEWRAVGESVDGLARSFDWLAPADLLGALAFYHDHRAEIDREIDAYLNSPVWS